MATSRIHDLRSVGHLYSTECPYGRDTCTYCGDTATTWDHVLPISIAYGLSDMTELAKKYRHALKAVPACRDCNNRASYYAAQSVSDKRTEIHRRLRKRFGRLLSGYSWGEDEIAELGANLRAYILASEAKREWIETRLGWPRNRDVLRRRSFGLLTMDGVTDDKDEDAA